MKTKQQFLLGELAKRIEKNEMTPEDRQYLVSSLYALSRGEDANKIFKMPKAKGARKERLEATYRKRMAITLIAALIRPKYESESDFSRVMPSGVMPSGQGLSEKEAIDKAYVLFKVPGGKTISTNDDYYISYETLEHYWREAKKENPELLRPYFLYSDTLPE